MAALNLSRSCLQHTHSLPLVRAFFSLSRIASSTCEPLDFLVPSVHAQKHNHGHSSQLPTSSQRLVNSQRRLRLKLESSSTNTGMRTGTSTNTSTSKRAFSDTGRREQTVAVVNPRKDEEGNEMVVQITARAANRLSEIMTKDSNPDLALRIQVESGGCHGFQYLMSLTTLPANAAALDAEDTVFEVVDGARSKARVVMDEPSLELLKGSKVDFTSELIGSQFKIVDNPLATSSCGCGTSFDIKI